MDGLAIRSIEIYGSAFLKGIASEAFIDRLAEKLGGFVGRAMSGNRGGGFSHYVCSSTFDMTCSGGWFDPLALTRKVYEVSGLRCSYSNAMQCATWGFLVRQHLANKPDVRNILISVVDGNPLGMGYWDNNVVWGKTGHKLTLVHLEIPEHIGTGDTLRHHADAVIIGKCNPAAVLYDYTRETHRAMARHPDHTLVIPYFEEKMRKGLKRSMAAYAYLPDLYEEYGHLYGSDPWMSIARDAAATGAGGKRYLASSFASEGYCCFLATATDAHSRISIESQA